MPRCLHAEGLPAVKHMDLSSCCLVGMGEPRPSVVLRVEAGLGLQLRKRSSTACARHKTGSAKTAVRRRCEAAEGRHSEL